MNEFMRVKESQIYAVHINSNVKDTDWRSYHALIVLSQFSTYRLISNLGYLEEDKTP